MKAIWQRLETCDNLWSVRFRLAVATGCMTLAAVVSASAAYASCAADAMASPHAFVGTVISTEKDDRIATVITDSGRQVKVLGTSDTSWFARSFSSTDRRYALGGRCEFDLAIVAAVLAAQGVFRAEDLRRPVLLGTARLVGEGAPAVAGSGTAVRTVGNDG
jgi:hypothetical protein